MNYKKILQWNTESNDTIVCIHGYADNAQMFKPLKSIFPDKRIISVNLPMNHSKNRIYDVCELSDYVRETLNKVHIKSYSLIGFSLGGLISTDLASKDRRVKKLMLLNSFPFLIMNARLVRNLLHKTTSPLKTKLPLYFYSRVYTNKTIKKLLTGVDLPDQKRAYMKDRYYSVFGTLLNCLSYSGLYEYHRLRIPKKIVLFEDDRTLPYKRFSRRANRHNLAVTTIKSGGHNKAGDYWKEVHPTLESFFK